jgi:anti-anti-sigma factor
MQITRTDFDRATLTFDGVLDATTCPAARPMIDALLTSRPTHITLDLSSLRLIDGLGIGTIVSIYKQLRPYGGEVRVVGLNSQPLTLFRLLCLDRVFALPAG